MWDCATPATRNDGGCEIVPRLPRKTLVDVRLCHACHVKRKWMSPSATPATHSAAASRATRARLNQTQARHPVPWVPRLPHKTMVGATPATQNACGCEIVPRLPRETKVDVTKCHACHAQCRGVTRDQGAPKPDPSAPPSAMSATPATQNDGGCEIVPRLPRKTKVDASLCYACHVKRRWMSSLCHACHVKPSPSATPATQEAPSAMSATPDTQIVCERWYVTNWCVKDGMWHGMWQSCVWTSCVRASWSIVCERWCVTKLCVSKVVC